MLGYPQYHSGDNEYSYCNLFWGMDKISYSYRSHYVVATGTYGLYQNQIAALKEAGFTEIKTYSNTKNHWISIVATK